jgi:hypothetical protein
MHFHIRRALTNFCSIEFLVNHPCRQVASCRPSEPKASRHARPQAVTKQAPGPPWRAGVPAISLDGIPASHPCRPQFTLAAF